jgi:rod shape determining protein RodA
VPIDRRLLFNVDWILIAATLLLTSVGMVMILSAAQSWQRGAGLKQLAWVGIGLVLLLVSLALDYRRLVDHSPLLYVLALGALAYVLFMGPRIANTRRWLVMGPVQIQPSEFAKLVAALLMAKVFAEAKKESLGLGDIVWPGIAVAILSLLIYKEPDLGTAVTLVPLFLGVAFAAGLRIRAVLGILAVLAVIGGFGWLFALKEYQRTRIYTFLDPSLDPKGAGYQMLQSQIAVGSGGLTGKGYRKGTQSQLGYLPARHTDFIFSVLAEELGFIGVVSVLSLYLLVLWRMLEAARLARDRVGALLAGGITALFAFQVMYNVAMVAGLVPVKGLPLPLMSYGGSSVLSSLLGVGLVLNVRMRRFAN